jgi:hypothetical protein
LTCSSVSVRKQKSETQSNNVVFPVKISLEGYQILIVRYHGIIEAFNADFGDVKIVEEIDVTMRVIKNCYNIYKMSIQNRMKFTANVRHWMFGAA